MTRWSMEKSARYNLLQSRQQARTLILPAPLLAALHAYVQAPSFDTAKALADQLGLVADRLPLVVRGAFRARWAADVEYRRRPTEVNRTALVERTLAAAKAAGEVLCESDSYRETRRTA